MTVLDTSVVVDYLFGGTAAAGAVERTLTAEGDVAAPDVLVFAALAAQLEEPLMTLDRCLATAAREHAGVTVVEPV